MNRPSTMVASIATVLMLGGCASSITTDPGRAPERATAPPARPAVTAAAAPGGASGVAATTDTSGARPITNDLAAELSALVIAGGEAWIECSADPAVCDEAVFDAYYTGELLELTIEETRHQRDAGWMTLPALDPAHLSFEIIAVSLPRSDGEPAEIRYCQVDGRIIIQPGAGPGGADVIVDDSIDVRLRTARAHRGEAGWRIETRWTVEAFGPEEYRCGH